MQTFAKPWSAHPLQKTLLLFTLFSLLSVSQALAESPVNALRYNPSQVKALIETSANLIRHQDFKGVALLYHYPPGYSQTLLQQDLDGIASSLQIFAEDFGAFHQFEPIETSELYVDIFATGGTHDYWDKYPDSHKVVLRTNFTNYGPGYIIFQIVDILPVLEVKAIAYGLPASYESVERIKQTGQRMLQLMEAQSRLATKQ